MHDYSRNERSFVSLGFLSHQDYYFVKGILKQVKEREQQKIVRRKQYVECEQLLPEIKKMMLSFL